LGGQISVDGDDTIWWFFELLGKGVVNFFLIIKA